MAVLKCKMCMGNIIPVEGKNIGVCDSCGTTMTMPSINDERRADAFNRGNHFRKVYEFDKALEEYSQIVKEDPNDAEAHWCMTLCRYGINYQEDHRTHERIPTCDRVSYTSILEDPDYQAALKHADADQKRLYQAEAQRIFAIQQGILEVSSKEKPFDVFICFKDTDDKTGKSTKDSVLAQDLYSELSKRGFKVFFSRITLKEEHMGQEWEPYIFAALNSAKVMLVVGTTRENFDSPWVKNEWSRFLNLRRSDRTKILIPCVSGMNPGDLPAGLKELEGRDMNEISFMQDILYGIERVVRGSQKTEKAEGQGNKVSAENYVKRALMAIEDGDNKKADQMLEQALNLDPENGDAHLGKLLLEKKVRSVEKLAECQKPLASSSHYTRALKFCDLQTQQVLRAADAAIRQRIRDKEIEEQYIDLKERLSITATSEFAEDLVKEFEAMGSYKNCPQLAEQARGMAERLRKKEADEKKAAEEKAAREQAEKERQKELMMEEERRKYKIRKRKARNKRIRRFVFLLIILAVAAFFGNKKILEPAKAAYSEAESYMEAGDYQNATLKYFEASESKLAQLFLKDAKDKGYEACTAWLGWEPCVIDSEDYPWLSLDEYGGLHFDPDEYVEEENFTMPTIMDGELVTGFGDYCFEGISGLRSLNVPENYTWIGTRAFADCGNLTALELSENTTSIGEGAFRNCDSLTSMVIPASVESIGNFAFEDCDYLNNITLSSGLASIGEGAFRSCEGLTSVYIPGSVQSIGFEAFVGTSLVGVTLEDGVGGIGESAFENCDSLVELTIPGSVTEIGPRAFNGCDALTSVTLGSGVEIIGEEAFYDCELIWNLALSDTLKTINARAFSYCHGLTGVSLPSTMESVGDEAFLECANIGEVYIADNNGLTIAYRTFYGCDNLTGAYVGVGTTSLGESVFDYCEKMTWVTLPEGLTSIGNWCFSNCALYEVSIPSTVTTLGEGAFNNCSNLAGVTVPEGIAIIETRTFSYCDNLYWVWMPGSLTIVRDDAFVDCPTLCQVWYSGSAENWNTVSKGNNEVLNTSMLIPDFYGYE